MATAPGIFKLASDSRRFVFDNFRIFMDHIKIIFPCILLIELVNSFSKAYHMDWIAMIMIAPLIYLYACLALSWHRTSILEPSSAHAIDPFSIKPENKEFIKFFALLSIIPAIAGLGYGVLIGVAAGLGSKGAAITLGLLGIPLLIWGVIYIMRISFVLPARAIGMEMSLEQAKKASKGMIGKIFGAGLVIGVIYVVIAFIYAFIAGIIAVMILGTEGTSGLMSGIGGFIITAPISFASLVVTATTITILSKAFQWRVQNG